MHFSRSVRGTHVTCKGVAWALGLINQIRCHRWRGVIGSGLTHTQWAHFACSRPFWAALQWKVPLHPYQLNEIRVGGSLWAPTLLVTRSTFFCAYHNWAVLNAFVFCMHRNFKKRHSSWGRNMPKASQCGTMMSMVGTRCMFTAILSKI